jgi:transposase InsO family protein
MTKKKTIAYSSKQPQIHFTKTGIDTKLAKLYEDPSVPGAYSGASSFIREVKKREKDIDGSTIKLWLQTQDGYTLHKPTRKLFKRNRIIVNGIDDTFQMDLVDVSTLADTNDGHNFILTAIDVFSKFAWAIPLKNKSASAVNAGLKEILDTGRIPQRIHTDQGKEFLNKIIAGTLKKYNIKLYTLNSEMKASIVERFNRTLREKMWRYFSHHVTYRYIDILQDLLKNYNGSFHRSIKTTPFKVSSKNEASIWKTLYGHNKSEFTNDSINFKFQVGDHVRISTSKNTFEKGYSPNWSREIFIIQERLARNPPVYILKDTHDTEPTVLDGIFYEQQLQKINVPEDKVYYIKEVVKERKTKSNQKESLVKWLGYPEKFNSWINNNTFTNTLRVFKPKANEKLYTF